MSTVPQPTPATLYLHPALAEQPAPSRSQQILQTILPWQSLSGEKESSHLPAVCSSRAEGEAAGLDLHSLRQSNRLKVQLQLWACNQCFTELHGRSLRPALTLSVFSWAEHCLLSTCQSHHWSSRCFLHSTFNPAGIPSRGTATYPELTSSVQVWALPSSSLTSWHLSQRSSSSISASTEQLHKAPG